MQFKLGEEKEFYKGKFITLYGRDFLDKAGKPQVWEYVKKNDVVAVFPITNDGKAVLIKNFRVSVGKYVIETPAGLTDHDGESHEKLAHRELMEETGYVVEKLYPLPPYPYRSGTSANLICTFIGTGAKRVKENTGDATEDISIIEVPLAELYDFYLHLPPDALFSFEILACYEMAKHLKLI